MSLLPELKRALICLPRDFESQELRDIALEHFGDVPAWIVQASPRLYALAGETELPAVMRLAACGESGQADELVMLLQLGDHQLRCIASLSLPLIRTALEQANRSGTMRVMLTEEDGHRFIGLMCDVDPGDLTVLARLSIPAHSASVDRQISVQLTAMRCTQLSALPSIISGQAVTAVEVAMVGQYDPATSLGLDTVLH